MKMSIRTKFNLGILVLFLIIMILLVFSAFNLNKVSRKTNLILSENHYSVVYAREMSENLINLNQEFTNSFFLNNRPDSLVVNESIKTFNKSLDLEKLNFTEIGESELVTNIEKEYKEYCYLLTTFLNDSKSDNKLILLQKKFASLNHQILLLSQMNEKAIEQKTGDAKVSANKALIQMTIIGIVCFLFALTFTYNFALYFNERFFQLYNGIKEIVSSNYGQRLYFDGKDEFYEISLLFNEMAEKLNKIEKESVVSLKEPLKKDMNLADLQELKRLMGKMKVFEKQANEMIIKLGSKS
jgi:two-component system, NtrC family, sensor histidine kinase KinB